MNNASSCLNTLAGSCQYIAIYDVPILIPVDAAVTFVQLPQGPLAGIALFV